MAKNVVTLKLDDTDYSIRPYATCHNAADNKDKIVNEVADFSLCAGATILIRFGNSNNANDITLNVNKTGAKPVKCIGCAFDPNLYYEFVYDGLAWVLIGDENSRYSLSSGNQNNYPWRRIAYTGELTTQYIRRTVVLILNQAVYGGRYGELVIKVNTNSTNTVSSYEAYWLVNKGFPEDSIKIGAKTDYGNTYFDVFYKCPGTWSNLLIEQKTQGYDYYFNKGFVLCNSVEVSNTTDTDKLTSYECYKSIESAGKELHGVDYTTIVGPNCTSGASIGEILFNGKSNDSSKFDGKELSYFATKTEQDNLANQIEDLEKYQAEINKNVGKVTSADNHYKGTLGAKTSGLYKVAFDEAGHITDATTVTKYDITNLGIPGSNTTYTFGTGMITDGSNICVDIDEVNSAENHYKGNLGGRTSGLYKIAIDAAGHITDAVTVEKSDITNLVNLGTGLVVCGTSIAVNLGTGLGVVDNAISINTNYITSGQNYGVETDGNGDLYVEVPWTDTDTKNTAGSTNNASTMYLIGATSQGANPQTYSNSKVYAEDGTVTATKFVGSLEGNADGVTPIVEDNVNECNGDKLLKYYTLLGSTADSDGKRFAGTANSYGFPVSSNVNGLLWLGNHSTNYGHQLGFSSNGKIYHRKIDNGSFPTTEKGGSWKQLAFTSDIQTIPESLKNPFAITFSSGSFEAKTYDGSGVVTVNIPTTFNHISDATDELVDAGSVTRKTLMCTTKKSQGYTSRITFGLKNTSSRFGSAIIGVGSNDGGTTFTDYYFSPDGSITDSKGNTYAKTSEINWEAYLKWGGKSIAGSLSPVDAAMDSQWSANRLSFMPASDIQVEYSTDGGTTWEDYGLTDTEKQSFVTSGLSQLIYLGKNSTRQKVSADQVRVTITAAAGKTYFSLKKIYTYISQNGADGVKLLIEKAHCGSDTTYATVGEYSISGWSGWNSIPLNSNFGGGDSQTDNIRRLRLTYYFTKYGTNYGEGNATSAVKFNVSKLAMCGETSWANSGGSLASTGHLYSYDVNKTAAFPGTLKAVTLYENGSPIANRYYGATQTRTKNTVLAAPDGYDGVAAFRELVGNDLPVATSGSLGAIALGYADNKPYYGVRLSGNNAYVEVPWTDTKVTSVTNHYRKGNLVETTTSGLYKVAFDAAGHITDADPVTISDMINLGLPESPATNDEITNLFK